MRNRRLGVLVRSMEIEACPNCGVPRSEWPEAGFTKEEELYCCEGCADTTGCTCDAENDGNKTQ